MLLYVFIGTKSVIHGMLIQSRKKLARVLFIAIYQIILAILQVQHVYKASQLHMSLVTYLSFTTTRR